MSEPPAGMHSPVRAGRPCRRALQSVAVVAVVTATLVVAPLHLPRAAAAGTPQVSIQLDAGYGGAAPLGGPMPVQVTVTNTGPDLRATLVIAVGGQGSASSRSGPFTSGPFTSGPFIKGGVTVFPAVPFGGGSSAPVVRQRQSVLLASGTTKHFEAYLPADSGTVQAQVVAASGPARGKALATAQTQLSGISGHLAVAVVSDDATALSQLGSLSPQTFEGPPATVHLVPASLPGSAQALGAFGLVVFDNATTDALSVSQQEALEAYVTQGGSVLVAGGDSWHKTLSGLPADLVAMAPTSTQSLPGLTALASSIGATPLAAAVDVAAGPRRAGVTDLSEGAVPILVEAPHGAGRIFYISLDLAAPPVASWSGTPALLRQILVRTASASPGALPSLGYGATSAADVIGVQGGSIYQALANIPSLDLPSPALIAVILVVFILLVGPANYVVLRRLHRPDLAWVTIPLLVVLSAGSIYGFGLATKGTNVLADRVRLAYLQPGSTNANVSSGTGVFSPHTGTHDVSTSDGSTVTPLTGGFFYNGSQGMPTSSGPASGGLTISAGPPVTVQMDWAKADSIETFGETYDQQVSGGLGENLSVVNARLTGTVTNHLPEALTGAVALSGSAYHTFGNIRPGASVSIDLPLPAATVVTATASSLPDQIYLHTPAVCSNSTPCNITPGAQEGSSRPSAAQRAAQRSAQLLTAVLGQSQTDVTQPLFVAWGATPPGPVRVDGHPAQLNELDAFVLPLDAVTPGRVLAAGTIPARTVDTTGSLGSFGPPYMYPGLQTTLQFALPAAAWSALSLTTTRARTPFPFPGAPTAASKPAAAIFDFRTSRWDPLALTIGTTTPVPSIASDVSPDGLVLVRVAAGTGPTPFPQIDISGQEAGPA